MGLDESLFGFVFRAWRDAKAKRSDPACSETAATLEGARAALSVLASAVAERRLDVCEAESAGAVRVPRLHLPRVIDLGTTREDAQTAYLVRTAVDAALVHVGPLPARGLAPVEELLAALLVLPRALALLEDELPACHALYKSLCPAMRARRALAGPGDRVLDALVQVRLGVPVEEAIHALHDDAQRSWLRSAHDARVTNEIELHDVVRSLAEARVLQGTPPPLLFGALGISARAPVRAAVDVPGHRAPNKDAHEKTMRAREQLKHIDLGEERLDENPIVHSFEKLHTADEYRGGKKRADGEDELSEHGEALDELDLHEVTRSGENAKSVFHADLIFDLDSADEGAPEETRKGAIAYDEWDERKQRYRPGFCHVYVEPLQSEMSLEVAQRAIAEITTRRHREILALEGDLNRLRTARAWHKRQPDGPDIDTDAMVDRYADLRSGTTPTDRLYEARRRHRPDMTVLVLADASASTESWVLGQRVLDVAREALVVLGEAIDDAEIRLALCAFSSHTRRHCSFAWLKGFEEPWASAKVRVARLEASGYTRIGPALRHATSELVARPEAKKLLVLLSDGKATDYDQYEGRHGIGDVRKAVGEAEQVGVHVLALAIDRTLRSHLPAMFGRGRFEVLSRPDHLPRVLGETCASLLRQ